ncbi:hypothetical protein LOK49_LG13G00632 [Camellia lanceoleosa]|uniref:Uncharacterized protein n=1 Tax=Camellia lanceoleosa TaxID=1840588 RepID=A0ACC0FJY6_9ERIC|nr:hypothetical protein LOK49_LG13G00632 [Camellia lanceoleosa]
MNVYEIKNTIVKVSSTDSPINDTLRVRRILGTPDFVLLPSFPKSVSMKLLIWNCRGAGNKAFRRTMKELEKTHKPSIIVLMVTKVELSSIGLFFNKLGFTASSHVDPVGRSGRIWILWDPFRATVMVFNVNAQVIHAKIKFNKYSDWILSNIYGSPNPRLRDTLWENLEAVAQNMKDPWLLEGDFNDIASQWEKRNFNSNPSLVRT